MCKSECKSEVADVLYILRLLGTPDIGNTAWVLCSLKLRETLTDAILSSLILALYID